MSAKVYRAVAGVPDAGSRAACSIRRGSRATSRLGDAMDAAVRPDTALLIEISGIARKLGGARQALGMTHEVVAARLGVARGTVREWEHARQFPTLAHLMVWCRVVGLRVILIDSAGRVLRPRMERRAGESWAEREVRRLTFALRAQRLVYARSQSWLAERLGMARPSASRLENGGSSPRLLMLARWAALYGCALSVESAGLG